MTIVPNTDVPYPLLIALHGGGLNATHSAEKWTPAVAHGWLTTHPQADNLAGYGQHWWDSIDQSRQTVKRHVTAVRQQYVIDPERIILGGFSSGGQVALQMALEGELGAKGFILVGAGGQHFNQPASYWEPLMATAPNDLRGVMLYSAYDLERSGNDVEKLLRLCQQHGIVVSLIQMEIAGHGFPSDFAQQYKAAISFIVD